VDGFGVAPVTSQKPQTLCLGFLRSWSKPTQHIESRQDKASQEPYLSSIVKSYVKLRRVLCDGERLQSRRKELGEEVFQIGHRLMPAMPLPEFMGEIIEDHIIYDAQYDCYPFLVDYLVFEAEADHGIVKALSG